MSADARTSSRRARTRGTIGSPTDEPSLGVHPHLDVLPGQYFVRIDPDAVRPHVPVLERASFGPARMAFTLATSQAVPEAVVEPLEHLERNSGLRNVRPLFRDAGRNRVSTATVARTGRNRLAVAASVVTQEDDEIAGLAIAELDAKAPPQAIRHAASAGAIDFIEPVPARWLAATRQGTAVEPTTNLQWGLRAIRWFDAKLPDALDFRVGILDTGIDARHPDLANVNVVYDHRDTRAEDLVGHGTHVAGIIAAETNNPAGIAGVARCAINVWKVFGDKPYRGDFYVNPDLFADALRTASDSGLSALNLSLGGTRASNAEQVLIRRLHRRGVVVVAAMGNDYRDGNQTMYPAGYDDVLGVGSVAENRERSDFSSTGSHIDLCAPGSNILSTLPRKRSEYRSERMYACWSGTSMAAPYVSAAAALVAAKSPRMNASGITARLCATTAPLKPMGKRARTNEYGTGMLDLARALS